MRQRRGTGIQIPLPFPPRPTRGRVRYGFRFIDLFAGIGGFRIGLESLGGTCVYSCEIDPFARRTYSAWFGTPEDDPHFPRDIRSVDPADIPDHQLLAAGFPCQPFSLAGVSKKNSLGKPHGFACQRQGNLFFEIIRIALARKTPALLLENVRHLERHDEGRTWAIIRDTLRESGYIILHEVVDARFWVPQHRERMFIACFRRDDLPVPIIHELTARQRHPHPLLLPGSLPSREPRVAEILEPDPDPRYVLSTRLWTYLRQYRDRHRTRGNGFGYGLVRPERDTCTRTLSARYHKDGSEILISRGPGRNPRRLTPLECARLMGFGSLVASRTDIPVSDTQAYRQFGNAVVPAVVGAVAGTVLDILARAGMVTVVEECRTTDQSAGRFDPITAQSPRS